jgi:hypothetical protein
MLYVFFNTSAAHDTEVIILGVQMSSSQHYLSVQSVQ